MGQTRISRTSRDDGDHPVAAPQDLGDASSPIVQQLVTRSSQSVPYRAGSTRDRLPMKMTNSARPALLLLLLCCMPAVAHARDYDIYLGGLAQPQLRWEQQDPNVTETNPRNSGFALHRARLIAGGIAEGLFDLMGGAHRGGDGSVVPAPRRLAVGLGRAGQARTLADHGGAAVRAVLAADDSSGAHAADGRLRAARLADAGPPARPDRDAGAAGHSFDPGDRRHLQRQGHQHRREPRSKPHVRRARRVATARRARAAAGVGARPRRGLGRG